MKQGFTLLELSIVLAVVGLIAGGIVAGSNMIRNAELQTIITDLEEYKSAVEKFKLKYESLPGDMFNATEIWGAAHANVTTCRTTASTGVETCNGNGNGRIETDTTNREGFRFWQHLANAELINGQFNGIAGTARYDQAVPNENSPSSETDSTAVWWMHYKSSFGSCCASNTDYGNTLFLGGTSAAGWNVGKLFTPKELWGLDKKIDDAHASKGKVWHLNYKECTLADDSSGTGTDHMDYDLSRSDKACGIAFLDVF